VELSEVCEAAEGDGGSLSFVVGYRRTLKVRDFSRSCVARGFAFFRDQGHLGRDSGHLVSIGYALKPISIVGAEARFGRDLEAGDFDLNRRRARVPLFGASLRLTPSGLTRKIAPGDFFIARPKKDTKERRPKGLVPAGRPRAHTPPRGTAATRHPGASLLERHPCRPTPSRGARSRQGLTGITRQNRTDPKPVSCDQTSSERFSFGLALF
jgi:hypothetical protein